MTFSLIANLAVSNKSMHASCIDKTNGFAYFGTDTNPGKILKIQLSDFTQPSTLTPTGTFLESMSIDVSSGFFYYGCANVGKTIGKVRLSDFTEVGTLTGTNGTMMCSTIDTDGGFVYFGQSGGNIEKVRLSDFTSQGNLATGAGQLSGAEIDKANDFMYFCDTSGNIVKVKISTFSVIDTINVGYSLSGIVIDTINRFAYVFGAPSGSDQKISQINLSNFTLVQTTPNVGDRLLSGVIDVANKFAYFGGDNVIPGAPVYQLDLKTFSIVTSKNTVRVNSFGTLYAAVIDTNNNLIYFGHYWEATISKLGVDIRPQVPSVRTETLGNVAKLGYTKRGAFINKASGKGASFT